MLIVIGVESPRSSLFRCNQVSRYDASGEHTRVPIILKAIKARPVLESSTDTP